MRHRRPRRLAHPPRVVDSRLRDQSSTRCRGRQSILLASLLPSPTTGFPDASMLDLAWPVGALALLLAYPVYVLLMGAVLAMCGVTREEIAKWALRQADRQRVIDLIRAARSSLSAGSHD